MTLGIWKYLSANLRLIFGDRPTFFVSFRCGSLGLEGIDNTITISQYNYKYNKFNPNHNISYNKMNKDEWVNDKWGINKLSTIKNNRTQLS